MIPDLVSDSDGAPTAGKAAAGRTSLISTLCWLEVVLGRASSAGVSAREGASMGTGTLRAGLGPRIDGVFRGVGMSVVEPVVSVCVCATMTSASCCRPFRIMASVRPFWCMSLSRCISCHTGCQHPADVEEIQVVDSLLKSWILRMHSGRRFKLWTLWQSHGFSEWIFERGSVFSWKVDTTLWPHDA